MVAGQDAGTLIAEGQVLVFVSGLSGWVDPMMEKAVDDIEKSVGVGKKMSVVCQREELALQTGFGRATSSATMTRSLIARPRLHCGSKLNQILK